MTRPGRTANRLRGLQVPPSRMTPALITDLAHRLTNRDRAILALVWKHRVLTTPQLTAMFFRTSERTQQRLRQLHHLHALTRFRPWAPVGTEPMHWVLGPAGAHVLAAERGISFRKFGYRHDAVLSISLSSRLGHQVGVNDFFAHLHAYARYRDDGTELEQWWSEQQCAELWGDLARPDAFGRWMEAPEKVHPSTPPQGIDFFLEHDTGTEPLKKVVAKLAGYAELADSTGITTPVLFSLPSAAREANLRRLLGTPEVPVATAVHTPAAPGRVFGHPGPAGPIWLPAGTTGPRQRLATLPDAWGGYHDPHSHPGTA
ncbi:replication-relaxation family protein [Spirillospora sp. NPDC050679]